MASKPIGSLYAALGLDSSQFDAGINKAQKRLQGFGDFKIGRGLKGGLDEIDAGMRGLASRAGVAGAALSAAGVAGVGAAAAMVGLAGALAKARDAMSFADEIADTAAKLRVSTDALQEYRHAVHALGGEAADADAALEGFTKAFGAAHAGLSKKAAKPFAALGLDPKDFDSTEEALDAVIDKIAGLGNAAEQAAIAEKLGLGPMLTALRAGGDEIERLRREAHQLGIVMDASLVARAGEANDEFEVLAKVVDIQLKSALVDLAPVLTGLLGLAAKLARTFGEAADNLRDAKDRTDKGLQAEITRLQTYRAKNLPAVPQTPAQQRAASAIEGRIAELWTERVRREREAAPAPSGGDALIDVSGEGGAKRDRSAEALADLELRELNARMALTENVERLSAMKTRQVDIETEMANRAIRQDAAEGTITAAAAKIAIAKNNELADLEKQKIDREATAQLVAQEFEQREAIASEYEKVADLAADEAATAAQRNAIEAKALADRQKLERDRLDEEIKQKLQAEAISQSGADALRQSQADRQAAENKAHARKAQARIIDEETDVATSALRKQEDQLQALAMVARSTYARAVIEAKILKLRQKEERLAAQAALKKARPGSAEEQIAQDVLDSLEKIHEAQTLVAKRETDLAHAVRAATDDLQYFRDAFRRRDWAGVLDSLASTIETVGAALSGGLGGLFSSGAGIANIAGLVGSLVGGKAGKGLMVGGAAYLGLSQLGGMLGVGGSLSSLATIGIGRMLSSLAGPIGIIAGLASMFIGSKPSNHAGIAQISGDTVRAVSSGKETEETQQAALGLAQSLVDAQKLLKAAGVELAQTVHAVDLGTRDKTRIVLSDGSEFRTNAVGDPAEAAETTLKRLLQGATYADEALKQLVESAIAAGKGFDEIATILQAQQVTKELADQILQLTDPKAFEVKQVKAGIQQQRDAAKALFDQGALTADQLARINDQLSTLEGLQLDEVMKRFGDTATDAADKWKSAAESLKAWLENLTGLTSSPAKSTAQAYSALQGAAMAARGGDAEAADKVVDLANAYLAAAKASASSQFEYGQAIARARAIVSSVQLAALDKLKTDPPPTTTPAPAPDPTPATPSIGTTGGAPPTSFTDGFTLTDEQLAQMVSYAVSGLHFATGGSFTVGGSGGADSQLVSMALTPGEVVNVSREDSMAGMVSELASLRADVRAMATTLAGNSSATKKLLDRWDGEGLPAERAS